MSDSVSVSSFSSKSSSGSRGAGILSNDPVTIDGTTFLKIRQCPASGVKNSDANVIRTGKWGPTYSKYAMWQRGSSTNPDSRYERVSVLTWKVGGFADEFPNMDDFVMNMKDNPRRPRSLGAPMQRW